MDKKAPAKWPGEFWTGLGEMLGPAQQIGDPLRVECHITCSEAIGQHGAHGVEVEVHVDGGFALGSACRVINRPGFGATL